MKRMLLQYDWDVIAGALAAVIALILHFLHIAEGEVVLAIILALLALLLLRDLRAECRSHRLSEEVERINGRLLEVQQALVPPDALLIGPQRLRQDFERFARDAQGDLTWFNVCCLMFKRQEVFDVTLRLVIDNPRVTSIQLICDESEKALWESEVVPKIQQCAGANKVRVPLWGTLPETISFMLADVGAQERAEVLLSFWGEPFMARTFERSVPRYIFPSATSFRADRSAGGIGSAAPDERLIRCLPRTVASSCTSRTRADSSPSEWEQFLVRHRTRHRRHSAGLVRGQNVRRRTEQCARRCWLRRRRATGCTTNSPIITRQRASPISHLAIHRTATAGPPLALPTSSRCVKRQTAGRIAELIEEKRREEKRREEKKTVSKSCVYQHSMKIAD